MANEHLSIGAWAIRNVEPKRHLGSPQQIENWPKSLTRVWSNFSGGYVTADAPEDISENSSPALLDMEVSRQDRLISASGLSRLFDTSFGPTPVAMVVHASLDQTSELLLFIPPYIWTVDAGEDSIATVIADLPVGKYVATNYAGTLLFTAHGTSVWSRDPRTLSISVVPDAPAGRTIAVFANRVLIGDTFIGGRSEPLGVVWSSSVGFDNWTDPDSGFELLISDQRLGDRIVAFRPIGLGTLAVLNRLSLWIGRPTNDPLEPIEFAPRVIGVGCVSEATCQQVEIRGQGGVIFLSDTGVRFFDINTAEIISEQINQELLPIDQNNVERYRSVYDTIRKRYYLFTPTETWVFDLDRNRWYRLSAIVDFAVMFADQYEQMTWENAPGIWLDQVGSWADQIITETNPHLVFFAGDGLFIEDAAMRSYGSGAPTFVPQWTNRPELAQEMDTLMTTQKVEVTYFGSGRIKLEMPDLEGRYQTVIASKQLTGSTIPLTASIPVFHTSKGIGMRLSYLAGNLEITRIAQTVMPRDNRLGMV